MSVRTYLMTAPRTYEGLKEKVLEAQREDIYLEVDGIETGNQLGIRRGEDQTRHFSLFVLTIQPIADDYALLGQDMETYEWVNINVSTDGIIMTVC